MTLNPKIWWKRSDPVCASLQEMWNKGFPRVYPSKEGNDGLGNLRDAMKASYARYVKSQMSEHTALFGEEMYTNNDFYSLRLASKWEFPDRKVPVESRYLPLDCIVAVLCAWEFGGKQGRKQDCSLQARPFVVNTAVHP